VATTIPSFPMSLVWLQSLASKSSVCGGDSGDHCDTDSSFSFSLRAVDWDVSDGSVIARDYGMVKLPRPINIFIVYCRVPVTYGTLADTLGFLCTINLSKVPLSRSVSVACENALGGQCGVYVCVRVSANCTRGYSNNLQLFRRSRYESD